MRFLHTARLRGEALLAGYMPSVYHGILRAWGRSNGMKLLLVSLVHRGDVVFDVGANKGIFTALMSNLVGRDGSVHAFEPSPDTCTLLRATLADRARNASNVMVNASAVGAADGFAVLYTPRQDHGQASLRTHATGSWAGDAAVRSAEVPVLALDTYMATHAPSRVDVVKMDVEGAELPALRGFTAGLGSLHPVIVCELCGAWTRAFHYEPSAVVDELRAVGYDTFFLVAENGGLHALTDATSVNDGESHDLVAIVAATHGRRVRRLVN
jgi:FkbM family methyltransferase